MLTNSYPFAVKIALLIPKFWHKLIVQKIFCPKLIVQKISNLEFQKQPLDKSLGETNIKHCKIKCRFELDIGLRTAESAVEFNPTLAR